MAMLAMAIPILPGMKEKWWKEVIENFTVTNKAETNALREEAGPAAADARPSTSHAAQAPVTSFAISEARARLCDPPRLCGFRAQAAVLRHTQGGVHGVLSFVPPHGRFQKKVHDRGPMCESNDRTAAQPLEGRPALPAR